MILNEADFDEIEQEVPSVETEVVTDSEIEPEGPKLGIETGIANIIHDLIIDENEAIQGYNNAAANMEDYPELQKIMHDIAGEEFAHIGELQKALEILSPNAANIEEGEVESEENLDEVDPGSPVDESLDESVNISDDMAVIRAIDKALAENPVSEKLSDKEIESLANSVNEFLHQISEKKARTKRF